MDARQCEEKQKQVQDQESITAVNGSDMATDPGTTSGASDPSNPPETGIARFEGSAEKPTLKCETITKRKARSTTAKRKRDDSKPDHPLSGYNFFFREERVRFLQEPKRDLEPGENRFTSMGKEIARRWKQLTREEAQRYHEMAAKDLLRYRKEMEEYSAAKARALEQVKQMNPSPSSIEPNFLQTPASGWMELGRNGHLGEFSSLRNSRGGYEDFSSENALAQLLAHSVDGGYATAAALGQSHSDCIDYFSAGGDSWLQGRGQRPLAPTFELEAQGWSPAHSRLDLSSQLNSEQLLLASIISGAGGSSFNGGGPLGSTLSQQLASQQNLLDQYALLQLLANSSSNATSAPPSLALSMARSGMSNSVAPAPANPTDPRSDLVTQLLLRQLLDQQGEGMAGPIRGHGNNPTGFHK